MVCPVMEQASKQKLKTPTEYPYEPLYRPWSWVLSTFGNLFLFAVIVLVGYALYRKQRKNLKRGRSPCVSHRSVRQGNGKDERDDVLVLGAQTVFGRHLVKSLLADGAYNVHCLDSYIPYQEDRLEQVCSYTQADVTYYEDMLLSVRGRTAVFHCDNVTPQNTFLGKPNFHHHNVDGAENVVRVCQECGVKRLVYVSAAEVVIGRNWTQVKVDESALYPKSQRNSYRASLAAAEQHILNSNREKDLATCAVRLAPVVLSRDDPLILTLLSQSIISVSSTSHSVTTVCPEAAAKATIAADKKLKTGKDSVVAGKAYNLGNNTPVSFSDLLGSAPGTESETTIWSQSPPTEISKSLFTLLAYANYYGYKLTGSYLHSESLCPLGADVFSTEMTFSCGRAKRDLEWEDNTDWKTTVARLALEHKARQQTKKER